MNQIKTLLKKLTKPVYISIVVLFVIVIFIIFTSWALYNRTVNILIGNLKERFLAISIIEATNIDSRDLNALQTESDWKKPEWARVVSQLNKAKYSGSDIVFMYIIRKTKDDPTKIEFVADADSVDPYANTSGDQSRYVDVNRDGKVEPDGPDKLQWPGQLYYGGSDIPEIYEAYKGPLTVKDIYTDEYGSVFTGYAPIKDENGNTVAILATDIKADDFFTITKQTLQPFLIFIATLSLIISILIFVVIYFWMKNTKYLQGMNEKLESLDKLKTEFLSLATHQLRSPLASIIGYTSMIIEGSYGAVVDAQKEALDRIFQSGRSLSRVIEDFLSVSKIESGGMKYEKANFDFAEIANSATKDLSVVAEKHGLKLIYDNDKSAPYMIKGDKEKLRQVVLNLIDNAIKYTKTGTINVSVSRKNDNMVFAVKDSGAGISPEIMLTLFQKFARGDGGKINTTGSGVGLYLAKEIVKAHDGRTWAESQGAGKGSTFIVELPLSLEK